MPIETNLLRAADDDTRAQRRIIEEYFKRAHEKYSRASHDSGAEKLRCADPTQIEWSHLDIRFLYRDGARFDIA